MNFDIHRTTDFDCPYCFRSKLSPKRGEDQKLLMLNGLSPEHGKYHETASEHDEVEIHAFALLLHCTNPDCGLTTIAVGRLKATPYEDDFHKRRYDVEAEPRFFQPPVDVVRIPDCVPDDIRAELRRSYAVFFCDPSAAANALRVAIECLMDKSNVPSIVNGRKQSLHARLLELKKSNHDVADLLGAVKWLGNDGSHYSQSPTSQELLSGYSVFLHAATKLFNDPDSLAKSHAAEISKGRGL